MAYAKELTRKELERLGVTEVFPLLNTCHLLTPIEGPRIKSAHYDGHYYVMQLYDPDLRKTVAEELRDTHTGQIYIPFHRLVYAWFNGSIPEGMVVDHIDDDKLNNDPRNLQLLTPSQNINKNRPRAYTKEIKCSLYRPLAYYETELAEAEEAYEIAKINKDKKGAHNYRSMVAYRRAQILYYKNHKGDK